MLIELGSTPVKGTLNGGGGMEIFEKKESKIFIMFKHEEVTDTSTG